MHPSRKAQGGAAVYTKKSLQYSPDAIYESKQFQMCAIRIPVNGASYSFASLYCPPSCKATSVDFDLLFQKLSGTWLVRGDLNAMHQV